MTPQPNTTTHPTKMTPSGPPQSYTPRLATVTVLQAVAKYVPINDGGTLRKPDPLPFKIDNLLESARPHRVNQPAWSTQDVGLFHAMTVGCVRYWVRLNAWITHLSQCDWKRLEPTVGACLRLGLFQILELDDVPDYAAVSSTLEVAEALGVSKKSRGFINGVLRSATRAMDSPNGVSPLPKLETDPLGFLTTHGSLPTWWAERLLKRHSLEEISGLLAAYADQPALSLRINTLKITVEDALEALKSADISVIQPDVAASEMLLLPEFKGLPTHLEGYLDGLYYAQEPSSALVARFLNPQQGERVLDLCAAPGSKTSHMAALMNNTGMIVALEPKAKRLAILESNLERLGITCITCLPLRGEALLEKVIGETYPILGEPFDKVLVDAPCSGLGTIRKHPELLLTTHEKHIIKQAPLQKNLLEAGLSALKVGGTLVYSTCSNEPEETDAVVNAVLAKHPKVTMAERIERHPYSNGFSFGDGFTMFRLIKSE